MPRFSANLGFLWTELSLPDAILAAAEAGFDAVECHWPYGADPNLVRAALLDSGIPMLSLNTRRGDVAAGENGLSALPGREAEARAAIDEAFDYAEAIDAQAVHVMAGVSDANVATVTFEENLRYAVTRAGHRMVLIEALNPHDAPGYFVKTTAQAVKIIEKINAPNLKLMFDCYHVARMEGDVLSRLKDVFPHIGHFQFASVPDRGPPDQGDVDYRAIFAAIDETGWSRPLGAEYRCHGPTAGTLGWMARYR